MSYTVIASPADLDSISSIYLIKRALGNQIKEIRFMSHSEIENIEADFLVDTPHGKARIYRFDHHDTKIETCSAMKVVEYFRMGDAEKRLAEAVCWQDNAGWRILDRKGLDNLLDTIIKSLECSGKTQQEILEFMTPIFDSLIIKFQKDIVLKEEMIKKIVYKSDNLLAINGDYPKDLIFIEFNPKFLLKYHDFSFSITRNAKVTSPDLFKFKDFLINKGIQVEGWFFHPQGFYVGFQGSESKRPNIDMEQLRELLEEYLSL